MNILEIAAKNGTYRMHSTTKGGEYVGPCPVRDTCAGAGDDRFHIWPEQGDGGSWWCRRCEHGGDLVQFLIEVEGLTFPEACRQIGRDLPERQEMATPAPRKRPQESAWQPAAPPTPAERWREHAGKFVDWAHERLLGLGEGPGTPLAYLAGRGISRDSAVRYRLGWNPGEKGKDLYRAREAWGLETILKDGDKKKKLWLPIGLVIPMYADGLLKRVRIRIPNERRTPEFSTPYYIVPGSGMDTFVCGENMKAYVIVEAELDAILAAQECAGLQVGAMAMGNSSAKPTAAAAGMLDAALHIENALDYDLKDGSTDNAGGVAWLWWRDHFPQAERWPVPKGKDPGDAFKAGVDIRAWVVAGLPPALTLKSAPPETKQPEPETKAPDLGTEPPDNETYPIGVNYIKGTSKGGHIYFITDSAENRLKLSGKFPGKAIFTQAEVLRLKGMSPDEAEMFIVIKEAFGAEAMIMASNTDA